MTNLKINRITFKLKKNKICKRMIFRVYAFNLISKTISTTFDYKLTIIKYVSDDILKLK